MRTSKAFRYLTMFGLILWSVWMISDHAAFHRYILGSITALPYPGLLAAVLALAGGASWWVFRRKRDEATGQKVVTLRGGILYMVVQVFSVFSILAFAGNGYLEDFSPATGILYYLCYSGLFFGLLLVVVLAAYAVGKRLIAPLTTDSNDGGDVIALALGLASFGFLLVLLGLAGLINIYTSWALVVLAIAANWRAAFWLAGRLIWRPLSFRFHRWWGPAAGVFLLAVIAFALPATFKTFPMGYDGAALYVNLAGLMADSGELPFGGQAFAGSVLIAWVWSLAGTVTSGILVAHLAGLLCALAVYRIGRMFLGPDFSRLAALIPLLSPYFAFHLIVDEKTDLLGAFVVLAGMLLWLRSHRSPEEKREVISILGRNIPASAYTMLLLGWLAGYAFTIKYTVLFFVFALLCAVCYRTAGRRGYVSVFLLINALIFGAGVYRFGYLDIGTGTGWMLGAGCLAAALGVFFFRRSPDTQGSWRGFTAKAIAFAVPFLVAFAPWGGKHLAENGSVGISQLIEGRERTPQLKFLQEFSWSTERPFDNIHLTSYSGDTPFRPRLVAQQQERSPQGSNATKAAAREEIQRYLGYEPGFWRYFSLPYDVAVGANIPHNRFIDTGFLLALFLPVLLFGYAGGKRRPWLPLLAGGGMILYLAGAYFAAYADAGESFSSGAVTDRIDELTAGALPPGLAGLQSALRGILLIIAEALAVPFALLGQLPLWMVPPLLTGTFLGGAWLFARRPEPLSGLWSFVALLGAFGYFWWLLGNGIVWYAMPMFVVAPVVLFSFVERPGDLLGDDLKSFSVWFGGLATALFLLVNTLSFFTAQYPNESDDASVYRWPFLRVATDPGFRQEEAIGKFNPVISEIVRTINADQDALVYRVNTHYGFLIKDNNTRVLSDPTLEQYDQIARRLEDDSKFFDMLKAQGFRYILFDLRTGTVDRTPEQTLRKKFVSIATQLTQSEKVRLVTTDNLVADPAGRVVTLPNGQQTNASYGLQGQTVSLGNLALFELR